MEHQLKIGILVADEDEFAPLSAKIKQGKYQEECVFSRPLYRFSISGAIGQAEAMALLCGVGKVNAAAGATALVARGCNIMLNYGLSGGIAGIARGEICLCDRFLEHDFDLTALGYQPCEKPEQIYLYQADESLMKTVKTLLPDIKVGTAATGDTFVSDPAKRDFLKREFGAMSCDMETAAIAYVCTYSSVPFLSVRRISDDAGESACGDYTAMNQMQDMHLYDLILQTAALSADHCL